MYPNHIVIMSNNYIVEKTQQKHMYAVGRSNTECVYLKLPPRFIVFIVLVVYIGLIIPRKNNT